MTTEEQNLNVEEKELVAVGPSVGAGCCGCTPDGPNEGAPLEQCMPGAAPAETNEPSPASVAAGWKTKEV
jgi:hypothetical protein